MAITVSGNTIQMPQGDTGSVAFVMKKGEAAAQDIGVFTLAQREGIPILRKILEPDLNDNAFHMAFVHEDTARLRPGGYSWSFRVLYKPQFDANGKLQDTQGQHTAVIEGRMMVFAVAGGVR